MGQIKTGPKLAEIDEYFNVLNLTCCSTQFPSYVPDFLCSLSLVICTVIVCFNFIVFPHVL